MFLINYQNSSLRTIWNFTDWTICFVKNTQTCILFGDLWTFHKMHQHIFTLFFRLLLWQN